MRLSGCQGEVLRRARIDRDRRADDIQEMQLDRDHMHDGRPFGEDRGKSGDKEKPAEAGLGSNGSSGRIRTYNLSVNSRVLCR